MALFYSIPTIPRIADFGAYDCSTPISASRPIAAWGTALCKAVLESLILGLQSPSSCLIHREREVMSDVQERLAEVLADRYAIDSEIGRGGMATVFLARDLKHRREVAIKVLHPSLSAVVGADRFLREIETVAGLTHPHILALHDSGEAGGLLYYVMPYIEGESLRERLDRETQLPVEEAVRIAREVASALDHAHARGIVHRDVKPANVLLSDGKAVLADFGVARMTSAASRERITATGVAVGTPAYMSPEQAAGEEADERTDTYALGCVLYELLTGEPPFTGPNAHAVMAKRLTQTPVEVSSLRESVPTSVSCAVARALARTPADRFATAALFGKALDASNQVSAPPPQQSVAVLPFENMSADPENEYFCDGVTEEIINALGQLPELKVAGRTSAFSFKGKHQDLRVVGEKLSVATVLEGSVRKAGDRIRITAQLIDVANGYHLWSERFDRRLDDVFAIQDEIAESIAERLQVTLVGERGPTLARPQTENVEAYQLYLKGRALLYQRGSAMRRSVACFRRALELDSGYALAYAGLSDAYGILGYYGMLRPDEAWPQARAAAERAVELGPELAEAHSAKALIALCHDWDWDVTEREFERAIELNPGFIQARTWYGLLYLQMIRARHEEAILQCRHAVELDPLSAYTHTMLGNVLSIAGQNEEAVEEVRRGAELDPESYWGQFALGLSCHYATHYGEARESYERALAISGRHAWALGALGQLHADSGRQESARSVYSELQARSEQGYVQPIILAMLSAAIGEPEEALRLAHQAADEKDSYLAFNGFCTPLSGHLRAVSGYGEILERMGLETT